MKEKLETQKHNHDVLDVQCKMKHLKKKGEDIKENKMIR